MSRSEKDCGPSDADHLLSVADLIDASDTLYRRWQRAEKEANEARDEARYIHRQWVMAKSREQAAMRGVPA